MRAFIQLSVRQLPLVAFLVFVQVTNVTGAILFSTGNPDFGVGGVVNFRSEIFSGSSERAIYQPVVVPTEQEWSITGFATLLAFDDDYLLPVNWELKIFTGVSEAGGTLLGSWSASVALGDLQQGFNPSSNFAYDVYSVSGTVAEPVILPGGNTYWISVAPRNVYGSTFIPLSDGQGTVNYPASLPNWNLQSGSFHPVANDNVVSFSLYGTAIPEPGAVASLLIVGLGAWGWRRFRRGRLCPEVA